MVTAWATTSQKVCIRVALCLHWANALSYSSLSNKLDPNQNARVVTKEHNAPA